MNASPMNTRMKRYAIALMCFMLSIAVRADEEGYRTFSDIQGRTFEGRLLDYEAASETVVLKSIAGKNGRMQLSVFSDADRLFIVDWAAERRFQEGLEVMPGLGSTVVSKKESGISDVTKRVFDALYEIRFMNRTDAPFEKIEFEYCIFYNQGERDDVTVNYDEGSCYGKGVVALLNPLSEHVSKTRSVRLYTEGGRIGLFGTDLVSLANVRGIWLRFKTKLPSGSEIMREYRTSDDADWKWAPYSFGAGLNEGAHKQTYYYYK